MIYVPGLIEKIGMPSLLPTVTLISSLYSLQNMIVFVALIMRFRDGISFRLKKSGDSECFTQTGLSLAEMRFLVTHICTTLSESQFQ